MTTPHEARSTSTERDIPGVLRSRSHADACGWHLDQYDHECDCGVLVRDGAAPLVIGSLRYHALVRACQHAREMDWPGDVDVLQRMIDVAVPPSSDARSDAGRAPDATAARDPFLPQDEWPVEKIYDKRGLPIEVGDVLKVFHFVGARRKRHFMYKQVVGYASFVEGGEKYMMISHLNFVRDPRDRDGPYTMFPEGQVLYDHEIVQSVRGDHEDRPKRPKAS